MAYIPSPNLTINSSAYVPSPNLVIGTGEPPPPVTYITLRSNYQCRYGTHKQKNNAYRLAWRTVQAVNAHTTIQFDKADQRNTCVSIAYSVYAKLNQDYKIAYGLFIPKNIDVSINWRELLPLNQNIQAVFGAGIAKDVAIKAGWNLVKALDIDKQIRYGQAKPVNSTYTFSLNGLTAQDIGQLIPWGAGIKPVNSYEYHPPILIVPVPPLPVDPPITLGNFNAFREDTGEAVELLACNIDLDKNSWAWSLSATVADPTSLNRIKPGAGGVLELHIEIAGYHWIFIIQSYTESKQFNENKGLVLHYKIQGLSKTAYLGHPFAPRRDYEQTTLFTANQLIDNELQFTGFTATFGITDWLIDAGAYSYSQKSPIESIAQIAAAPGALVVPDRLNNVIEIKYDYPESHWNWSAMANLSQITDDQILTLSGKYRPGVEYNGVYVTGQNVGITAWVRRTGTAGDNLHQTVIDSLITDAVPGRERGRNIISGSGNKMEYDLEMLFLDGSELYQISQILTVIEQGNPFQAKVESIEIEVSIKNDMPIAFQRINLIRHIQ